MIDLEYIAQLERNVRQGSRDGGTFGPAVDDAFHVMRALVADLANARFTSVAYLGRATRAEEACKELAIVQDLYDRARQDLRGVSAQAEIFRKSWLDYRDKCEALQAEIVALKARP